MVTWLTRSLLFIIAGAVLAFAVTADHLTYRRATLDLHTVGVILLVVGIADLLLNFGIAMYLRQPPRPLDPYGRPMRARPAQTYPDLPASDLHDTEVIKRSSTDWH